MTNATSTRQPSRANSKPSSRASVSKGGASKKPPAYGIAIADNIGADQADRVRIMAGKGAAHGEGLTMVAGISMPAIVQRGAAVTSESMTSDANNAPARARSMQGGTSSQFVPLGQQASSTATAAAAQPMSKSGAESVSAPLLPITQPAAPPIAGALVGATDQGVKNAPPTAKAVGETKPEVTLLMPPPPAGLSADDQSNLNQAQKRVMQSATAQATVPPADSNLADARQAVTEPPAETQGRAQNKLILTLGRQIEPSPQILELCKQIRRIIAEKRPTDEQSLLKSDFEKVAQSAGQELDKPIAAKTQQVEAQYAQLGTQPQGTPQQLGQPIQAPPNSVGAPPINATAATPKAIPPQQMSLQPDVQASQKRINDAGMNSPVAQEIQTGPIADARAGQTDLVENAAEAEAAMIASQNAALMTAHTNMGTLQEQALQALLASRQGSIRKTSNQQTAMMGEEVSKRERISMDAQDIFDTTQKDVKAILNPLKENVMAEWNAEVAILSRKFKADLASVDKWKKERYEGLGGSILEVLDDFTGAPKEVTRALDRAEKSFGDGVCDLLIKISITVNTVIATCEKLIADAGRRIDALFRNNLPAELASWAEVQRKQFQEKLNGLQKSVVETRNGINNGLVQEASKAVQEVREEIARRREEAKGKLQKIAEAIAAFVDDPIRGIINGLLSLVGIPPASFWTLVERIGKVISDIANDPLGFAKNLLSAIGKGFKQFFDAFGKHILAGFWEWLFSGLGALGVEIPTDFSIKSIVTFILQLLGVSWARIRKLLAKHLGEKNIALIEKVWESVSTLIALGPAGLFEMIKDKLNPKEIVDQILKAAIDFLIETLITQVTVRVAMLFNPVGAIAQAVMAIYKVLKWIFTNAARIFSLIETVVNGMAALVAGDIGGMANAVEKSLVRLISPVIDFIAGLVGLGDLPNKIAKTLRGFQKWIDGILDRVIGWLAAQGKRLLQMIGSGSKEAGKDKDKTKGKDDSKLDIHEPFVLGTETHELRNEKGSDALVMASSDPFSLSVHPSKKVQAAYAKYLSDLALEKSPTAKRKAANRNLRVIVRRIKEAGGKDTPRASAPGIGTVDFHSSQHSRLRKSKIAVWAMESEHVIPRIFIDIAFASQALAGVAAGGADYKKMRTILIYKGAANLKTQGPSGDNSAYHRFTANVKALIETALTKTSRAEALMQMGREAMKLFEHYADEAKKRTNKAIMQENQTKQEVQDFTNGAARGPENKPEVATPDEGLVNNAFELQSKDIRDQIQSRLDAKLAMREREAKKER